MVIVLGTLIAACAPRATLPPNPTIAAPHAYSICPQSGELPPQEVNDQAVAILTERLSLLGIADPRITVGACIEVALELPGQDPDAVQSAILSTGRVELVPVPADQVGTVQTGGAGPLGVQPLVGSADLSDATLVADANGREAFELRLTEAGAAALRSWTTTHVGGYLAIVVDGVAVAVPVINEPITSGSVQVSFPEPPAISLEALRVMVLTGPLPEAWRQPERPQG